MVLDASATRCVAGAASDVAGGLQPDEQAYQERLVVFVVWNAKRSVRLGEVADVSH